MPPSKLHRLNGYDALAALRTAARDADDGTALSGAPPRVLASLLTALEQRGFYLGVADGEHRCLRPAGPDPTPVPLPEGWGF